jgi:hypothetical protein
MTAGTMVLANPARRRRPWQNSRPSPPGTTSRRSAAVPEERRRADARAVRDLLARVTGEPAVMWGKAIVGFGQQHLR